jgi:predicted dehydrogenase
MSARAGPPGEAEDRITPLTSTQRVAVVGLGRAGVAHAVMLSHIPGCELVAVADPRGAARAALRGMGFAVPAFPRLERLLDKHTPDAVFVCAPQRERAAVARVAVEAGLPVLVERPMALTLEEAAELAGLAAARGVPLAVGHPLAHEPVFARLHELVRAGALGPVHQARSPRGRAAARAGSTPPASPAACSRTSPRTCCSSWCGRWACRPGSAPVRRSSTARSRTSCTP